MSSSNERKSNFWRNVVAGVGVAAAGAAIAYLAKEVIDSVSEEASNAPRPSNGGSRRPNSPRRRRNSKGEEPLSGLRKTIIEKLNNGTYECAICLDEIKKESPVIACTTCHQIYHIKCLRELLHFSRGEGKPPSCPTCRENIPGTLVYKCFCGKETNPAPIAGLTPHTCGAVCGRLGCKLQCHPGPCV